MAKDSIHFAVDPAARANLRRVYERAAAAGVDLASTKAKDGRRSESAAVRWAIEVAATAPVLGLDATPARVDGAPLGVCRRLKDARTKAGLSQRELALKLDLARSTVATAEQGRAPLCGRLLDWVKAQVRK